MRFQLACLASTALLFVTACSDNNQPVPAATAGRDYNLALGNPSGATTSTSNPSNYLLVRDQYALSYHRDQGKPNWVSWGYSSQRGEKLR